MYDVTQAPVLRLPAGGTLARVSDNRPPCDYSTITPAQRDGQGYRSQCLGSQWANANASVAIRLPVTLEKFLAVSPPESSHDPDVSHLQMPLNQLMRQCLLRRQSETSGGAFQHFWQHSLRVLFKDRFLGHLTTRYGVRRNSLAPKII